MFRILNKVDFIRSQNFIFAVCSGLFLWCSVGAAQEDPARLYERSFYNEFFIRDVLIQNRNSSVGLQYKTDLTFNNWAPFPEELFQGTSSPEDSFLGLSSNKRLFHVVKIGPQYFARLLSGGHCIKDFKLSSGGLYLVAHSCENEVLIYSPEKWERSPILEIIKGRGKRTLAYWGIMVSTLYAINFHILSLPEEFQALVFFMQSLMGSGALIFGQGAVAFHQFGELNTHPDGLISSQAFVKNLSEITQEKLKLITSGKSMRGHWETDCSALLQTSELPDEAIQKFEENDLF